MGKFKFNDKTSEDFGLVVQTPPTYEYPERDLTVTHIPGRNGDVIIDNNCYKNVQRTYSVGIRYSGNGGYYVSFEGILNWLNSANGRYVRLEDSYDSEVYRLASFQMNGNFTDYFGKGGTTTITFECKPQRFLKIGEKESIYNGNTAIIENASNYVAKPIIKVKGIATSFENVLMMSVLDKDGAATSSITISSYVGNMLFDSEEEVVTSWSGEDLSTNVGLNSLEFPRLKPGNNTIKMEEFLIESTTVNSYFSILSENRNICLSEYKTYAALEQNEQSKIFVKSYKTLIRSKQESYSASSVQNYITSISETYTFDSYNTLLSDYGVQYVFTGSVDENSSTKPSWLAMTQSGDAISAYAAVNGFFLVSGKDKKIYFRHAGELISNSLSVNSVNTITYFEAIANPDNAVNPPSYNNVNYGLQITYTDIPSWLKFVIEYDSEGCPVKIHYYKKSKGYYWTDKTWIFGKAQWKYYSDASEVVLATLNWNTSKKAFTNSAGLSLSTTSTFTYRYLNATPTTLPEYVAITTTTVDDRGVETVTVNNAVHFTVIDLGSGNDYSLSNICVKAKEQGFYSYQIDTGEQSSWNSLNSDGTIIGSISGTKTFGIFYLSAIPDYSAEEGWPDWLDPMPLTNESNLLVAQHIWFKVLKTSMYRVSVGTEDDTPQRSGWVAKNANDTLQSIMYNKTTDDAMYIYQIDELPSQFDYNRSYTLNEGEPSSSTPEWLQQTIVPSGTTVDNIPEKIVYSAKLSGYFRWDSNSAWVYYNANDELFEIGGKDDCIIYYMASLPAYSASDFHDPSMFSLFNITVVQSPNPGNPKEVNFVVASTGYYRANNSTSWKYLQEGETLLTAKVSDPVTIYHLSPTNQDLSNLEITIKPRWWKL